MGVVACRGHGAASTWRQATSPAIAALCSLAFVAADGGCQTLSALTEPPCLSRLIREGSGVWYRFQLLSLSCNPYAKTKWPWREGFAHGFLQVILIKSVE